MKITVGQILQVANPAELDKILGTKPQTPGAVFKDEIEIGGPVFSEVRDSILAQHRDELVRLLKREAPEQDIALIRANFESQKEAARATRNEDDEIRFLNFLRILGGFERTVTRIQSRQQPKAGPEDAS